MARKSQLRGAGAASTMTLMLLIGIVVINAFGLFGLESAACRGRTPSTATMGTVQIIGIAAALLAIYTLISFIKRRATFRSLPLEKLAALLAIILSVAWQLVYFIDCTS
ncbi:MAG: hypothetical protein ACE363_09570 [Alphaproteobacteria bacterium]